MANRYTGFLGREDAGKKAELLARQRQDNQDGYNGDEHVEK